MHKIKKEKDKSTRVYFEWLSCNIEYQTWLLSCPFDLELLQENNDKSITFKFAHAHLFDKEAK